MQHSCAKIFLAVVAFTFLIPESSARRMRSDGSVGEELHVRQDRVSPPVMMGRLKQIALLVEPKLEHLLTPDTVRLPFMSPAPAMAQDQPSNLRKVTLDGTVISFGLGSILSSGSAQQAVNQEGRREESAKQEKARKKTTSKESLNQESGSKESSTKTSGESGKGDTAYGTNERPATETPPLRSWEARFLTNNKSFQ